jgi:hypothetical protein
MKFTKNRIILLTIALIVIINCILAKSHKSTKAANKNTHRTGHKSLHRNTNAITHKNTNKNTITLKTRKTQKAQKAKNTLKKTQKAKKNTLKNANKNKNTLKNANKYKNTLKNKNLNKHKNLNKNKNHNKNTNKNHHKKKQVNIVRDMNGFSADLHNVVRRNPSITAVTRLGAGRLSPPSNYMYVSNSNTSTAPNIGNLGHNAEIVGKFFIKLIHFLFFS